MLDVISLKKIKDVDEKHTLKSATLEKELTDYKNTLAGININQEAKQSASGYGVVSLPKNCANGQVRATVLGNTITNLAGDGITSPKTITLDSAKTYLLIKTDGGTVNVDGVDTNVPVKITGKTSTTLTWTTGKIGLFETLSTEASQSATELAKKYTYVNGAKSTVSAVRVKSVGKNLFDGKWWNGYNFSGSPSPNAISFVNLVNGNTGETYRLSYGTIKSSSIVGFNTYDTNENVIRKDVKANYLTLQSNEIFFDFFIYNSNGISPNDVTNILVEKGIATSYEPYTESNLYINAGQPLRSLPNGTKDEVSAGKLAKRVGVKTNVASGTVINYADMAEGGQFVAYFADNTQQVGVKGDTLAALATTLTYQLATPVVTDIQTSGSLFGYPSGTIYVEPVLPVAGLYEATGIKVTNSDFPIATLEKISKIDPNTGVETDIPVSGAVIAGDKLSFTHPSLVAGDIVFFTYFHSVESTVGETTIGYYDSRYTIKDSSNGKFYQWKITSTNGVASVTLVEV